MSGCPWSLFCDFFCSLNPKATHALAECLKLSSHLLKRELTFPTVRALPSFASDGNEEHRDRAVEAWSLETQLCDVVLAAVPRLLWAWGSNHDRLSSDALDLLLLIVSRRMVLFGPPDSTGEISRWNSFQRRIVPLMVVEVRGKERIGPFIKWNTSLWRKLIDLLQQLTSLNSTIVWLCLLYCEFSCCGYCVVRSVLSYSLYLVVLSCCVAVVAGTMLLQTPNTRIADCACSGNDGVAMLEVVRTCMTVITANLSLRTCCAFLVATASRKCRSLSLLWWHCWLGALELSAPMMFLVSSIRLQRKRMRVSLFQAIVWMKERQWCA